MSYESERDRLIRKRGLLNEEPYFPVGVPPSQYSEVDQYMARTYQDEAIRAQGLIPGLMHDRRGVWEGLDAREIAQRQSMVGLYRASGFNRGKPNTLSFDKRNDPLGQDDNVRVFDRYPIPPGEYFVRPFSMQFDRVAMESALQVADLGFTFFAEYRNDSSVAAGATFQIPGSGVTPTVFNHDYPIERLVIINDSNVNLILSIDGNASSTGGAPGTGSGDFLVKPGEANTYPIRCYQFVQILNADGSTAAPADTIRVQLYGYKDSHPNVLIRGGGRPMQSDGAGNVVPPAPSPDFSPTLP